MEILFCCLLWNEIFMTPPRKSLFQQKLLAALLYSILFWKTAQRRQKLTKTAPQKGVVSSIFEMTRNRTVLLISYSIFRGYNFTTYNYSNDLFANFGQKINKTDYRYPSFCTILDLYEFDLYEFFLLTKTFDLYECHSVCTSFSLFLGRFFWQFGKILTF